MTIRFGSFTLDGPARQLLRGAEPIRLSPKAFDLLSLLVERRPDAVSKADIHCVLWPDTFVADINLAVLVAEVRAALGDEARHPRFLRTVHRFGYAFSATAVETGRPRPPIRAASCWLSWGVEKAPLNEGENLIGRDPSADVRIDAVGVSRRHALIVVADREVTVQDLSSKNGTYLGDVRVTAAVRLVDGSELRIGPLPVRFHRPGPASSTQTLSNIPRQ